MPGSQNVCIHDICTLWTIYMYIQDIGGVLYREGKPDHVSPPRDVSPQNICLGILSLLELMKIYKSAEVLTRWLAASTSFPCYPTPLSSFNHVFPLPDRTLKKKPSSSGYLALSLSFSHHYWFSVPVPHW